MTAYVVGNKSQASQTIACLLKNRIRFAAIPVPRGLWRIVVKDERRATRIIGTFGQP